MYAVILKELIFNSFHFVQVRWSWKNWFLTVSTLSWSDDLERTDFWQFLLWKDVVFLKELIFNSFYSGLGVMVLIELTFRSLHFVLKELIFNSVNFGMNMVVLKELDGNSFHFVQVRWSWKTWFLTVSTLSGCGHLGKTVF